MSKCLSSSDKYCFIFYLNDRHPAKEDLGSGLPQVFGANARRRSGFLKKGNTGCISHDGRLYLIYRASCSVSAGEFDRLCQLFDLDLGFQKKIMYNHLLPHRGKMWIIMETYAVLYTAGRTLKTVEILDARIQPVTSRNKAPDDQTWSRHTSDLMQNNNLCTHDIYLSFCTVGANKCWLNVALRYILLFVS